MPLINPRASIQRAAPAAGVYSTRGLSPQGKLRIASTRLEAAQAAYREAFYRVMNDEIEREVQGRFRQLLPKRTGNLRRSIHTEPFRGGVDVLGDFYVNWVRFRRPALGVRTSGELLNRVIRDAWPGMTARARRAGRNAALLAV